jgi:hypothetical protein
MGNESKDADLVTRSTLGRATHAATDNIAYIGQRRGHSWNLQRWNRWTQRVAWAQGIFTAAGRIACCRLRKAFDESGCSWRWSLSKAQRVEDRFEGTQDYQCRDGECLTKGIKCELDGTEQLDAWTARKRSLQAPRGTDLRPTIDGWGNFNFPK